MNQVLNPPMSHVGFETEELVTAVVKAKHSTPEEHFSETQWQELRAQDKLAGTAVVAVMTTIFTVGLLGYIVIAWLCARG